MPALAAHYFFGQEVRKQLPPALQQLLTAHQEAFNVGLQGPDILFNYRPLTRNRVNKLGSRLHGNRAAHFLKSAIYTIDKTKDEQACAYLMGMICHFTLDKQCHPYIDSIAIAFKDHILLESAFECKMIELAGENPLTFKRYCLIEGNEALYKMLPKLYTELSQKQLKKAICGMRRYGKLFYSPSGKKLRFLRFLEKCLTGSSDFSGMAISKDLNANTEQTEKLLNFYHEAIPLAAKELVDLYQLVLSPKNAG